MLELTPGDRVSTTSSAYKRNITGTVIRVRMDKANKHQRILILPDGESEPSYFSEAHVIKI